MEKIKLNIDIHSYKNLAELPETEKKLVEEAQKAVKSAYAPYSKFNVGAAVLLEDGKIITGTNQENAAYPSGLCAERVALFYANSQYPEIPVKAIAICAFHNGDFTKNITPPCGSCRQVMMETEIRFNTPIKVIMFGKNEILTVDNIKSLLPLAFYEKNMKL